MSDFWAGLTPPYRTIVADPPWDHSDGTGTTLVEGKWRGSDLPYSVMEVEEIAGLPVAALAAPDAHLYLWTTNRYLPTAYAVAEAWGFKPIKPLIWCKTPMGFMGRPFGGSSVEFCIFARRGSLRATGDAGRQWFDWARGSHSVKPAAFGDLVEQVSPGPYVELFARSPRLGWDSWGHGWEIAG